MSHYHYKCFQCHSQFSQEEIETRFQYLCPKCGKAEKRRPLEGVLLIEYEYDEIKKHLSREYFLKQQPGAFWKIPLLYPLEFNQNGIFNISSQQIEKLILQQNPLVELNINNRQIYILDDSRNPTLSFKDRASNLVALKALQLGIHEIAAASTGNAGSSLAGICARLGLSSHIFVPASIPAGKRLQIQAYGAFIYAVDGDYDVAFDLCLEAAAKNRWYNRNTAYNPLTIEGKKSAAYDIFISTNGNIPEIIFVPVGDGVIISGLFKGFDELKKLGWIDEIPQLFAVQAEGSDALFRYWQNGKFEHKPAATIADSICAGAPRNLYMAAHVVKQSDGKVLVVSDFEILEAQKVAIQEFGFLVEPAAAASLAGFFKFLESDSLLEKQKVLLLFTGNGLKDINSLKKWNMPPQPKTADEWRTEFLLTR